MEALAHGRATSPWVWHAHPDVWVLMVALLVGYVAILRWASPPGERATRSEVFCFVAGVLVLWLGADWPIHDLSEDFLFSVHMSQHMLFSFVAPPLLLMGLPRWLLRQLLAPAPLMRAARVLTRPLVALIVFNAFIAFSHWPAIVDLALRHEAVHFLVHLTLVTTSLMMWWPVVDRLPELSRLTPPTKMLYLFLQSVLPTIPASFLTFAQKPIYRFYESVPHPWIGVVTDQRISGLIMKIGGGLILWGVIAVLFFRWHAAEERQEQHDVAWDDFERELEAWDLRR
jgi:putative membrane protein